MVLQFELGQVSEGYRGLCKVLETCSCREDVRPGEVPIDYRHPGIFKNLCSNGGDKCPFRDRYM